MTEKKRGGIKKGSKKGPPAPTVYIDAERFAAAYLANGGNSSAALRECGHGPRYLAQHAYQATKRKDVQVAITAARNKLMAANFVTADKTVRELGRVAFVDIADLYDADGTLLHPMNMPEDIRHAIVSVEHDIIAEGITRTKIRLGDKVSALEKLSRHFGLFEADNRQKPVNQVAVILAEINPGRVDLLPRQVTVDQDGSLLPDKTEKPGVRLLDALRQG